MKKRTNLGKERPCTRQGTFKIGGGGVGYSKPTYILYNTFYFVRLNIRDFTVLGYL